MINYRIDQCDIYTNDCIRCVYIAASDELTALIDAEYVSKVDGKLIDQFKKYEDYYYVSNWRDDGYFNISVCLT